MITTRTTDRSPRTVALAAMCATLAWTTAAGAQQTAPPIQPPTVPVEKFTLPNGLTVLLSEDHSAPIAAVAVWYHVGSKNEKPGRTGFAHLFEHMMFTGSVHVPEGQHPKIVESVGGDFNGTTNNDRTVYYDVVPVNELATALWLESDRMGFLPAAMTQERLNAQKNIVQNERRQGVDNQPFGLAAENMMTALFPADNPYSWPVIGSLADLQAASMDDVKAFFAQYYAPNDATLSIVGDIDVAKTREMVTRYFSDIARGPAIERPKIAHAKLTTEKRLVLEDSKAQLPQMRIAWPTVGTDHADRYALAAVGAVLTADRTSRLTKLLVYDRQLATSVFANNTAFENAGYFNISVTPRPNASLTEIERVVDSVVTSVISAAPMDREVSRFWNSFTVSSITGLQSDLNKAMTLALGDATFGDPRATFKQLANYTAVTPADVQRVARQYLTNGRVVFSMVPAGKLDMVSKPTSPFTNVTPKPAAKP